MTPPQGALAASGAMIHSDDLVAAHAKYPLGSRVSVTNVANGKTVEVQIVDRLADARRMISVSGAAARQLGFYDAGTADVVVTPLREDRTIDAEKRQRASPP